MNTPNFSYHWLPFTSNRAFSTNPRLVVGAQGVHYVDADGRRVLDGISGLFCVPAGHGRPEIAAALSEQVRRLDFAPTFEFAHPDGFTLAERLARLLPAGLDRVFFVNSGSEAVETALKGALAYHRARGDAGRARFVGRERAYHGVNFGGLSVGGLAKNREMFGPGLPGVSHMRATWSAEQAFHWGQPSTGGELAEDLQRAVNLYGGTSIAAVIVEPIAGSSGGVIVPPEGYLERLAEIATAHGILLIFDEVITGFGRTGHAFASQAFGVTPDIITMAKALTNGAVPMGAVAFRRPRRCDSRGCRRWGRVPPRLYLVRPPLGVRGGIGRSGDIRKRGSLRSGGKIGGGLPGGRVGAEGGGPDSGHPGLWPPGRGRARA